MKGTTLHFVMCMVAYRNSKLCSVTLDKAYILKGFLNWKDAGVSFSNTSPPVATQNQCRK